MSDTPPSGATEPPSDALSIFLSGGATGLAIILLLALVSIFALALVVEHLLSIRRMVLMPEGLADQVRNHLGKNDLTTATRNCQERPSSLAVVLRAGMSESNAGWPAVEKRMEEALAEQSARLLRKIDYLSVIGNIAPMIGLLGTVIGMIFAFQEVADSQGAARAAELASGIYQALISTVGGLIIAIPSLAAFAVFRNRVDHLIAETGEQALEAIAPLKYSLQSAPPRAIPPQISTIAPPPQG